MYREDSTIDLTLKISDLLIENTSRWNEGLVRSTFIPKDAEIILKLKPFIAHSDSYKWGLSKDGCYTTKSGYRLLDMIQDLNSPNLPVVPPVEKKLWSLIWKIKAPPKLKHFLWRVLSGALAVKERLHSRNIQIDTTCLQCSKALSPSAIYCLTAQ